MKINDSYSLRLLEVDDAQALFQVLNSQRERMRVWLPFVDTTEKWEDIKSAMSSFHTPENPQFCILHREEIVGLIGFKDTDKLSKKTEIGYWLSFGHQGKGVMTQAVIKLLELAFDKIGLNRVQIKCAVGNIPSRSIPERLGFMQEGIERDGELLVDNKYTDLVIYSLLKKEFQ